MTGQAKLGLLAAVGLCAGLVAAVSIAVVGDTFGYPGSPDYRTYETFNRLMAGALLFEAASLMAFYLRDGPVLRLVDRTLVVAILVAWLGMAAGTAAEFWLFSDLPYSQVNLRSTSFSLFSLSSLLVGLASLALGLRFLLRRRTDRAIALAFTLFLPLDIALFVAGQSIFGTPAAFSIALAIFILARPATNASQHKSAA
jgi:hypothetical protein